MRYGRAMTKPSLVSDLGRGVLASTVGTAAMTVFQRAIEMPVTGRDESDAPAQFAKKVLPIKSSGPLTERQLNYVAHFGIGTLWGMAFAIAARTGLRGQKAVHVVFPVVLTGDILLNTALRLYKPSTWTKQEWIVDLVDKYVQAQATGAVFERIARS